MPRIPLAPAWASMAPANCLAVSSNSVNPARYLASASRSCIGPSWMTTVGTAALPGPSLGWASTGTASRPSTASDDNQREYMKLSLLRVFVLDDADNTLYTPAECHWVSPEKER